MGTLGVKETMIDDNLFDFSTNIIHLMVLLKTQSIGRIFTWDHLHWKTRTLRILGEFFQNFLGGKLTRNSFQTQSMMYVGQNCVHLTVLLKTQPIGGIFTWDHLYWKARTLRILGEFFQNFLGGKLIRNAFQTQSMVHLGQNCAVSVKFKFEAFIYFSS